MNSKELRQKYIKYFEKNGHTIVPSASLIPENDPSVLFTTAGMHPLVPFLLGEKHPGGKRLVNSQKCIRTGDIDEVGDKVHHTFFEMLGHWSLGDYFKKQAIEMSYIFLTQELGLDKNRLAFSIFEGDKNISMDNDALNAWLAMGVSRKRIKALPRKENWWELGSGGPCGPDTEMFYFIDNNSPVPEEFNPEDKRWVEIGNDVLIEYNKIGENKYEPAKQKNIDNGTGLERLLAVMNGLDDNYLTDLFKPIIEKIEDLSDKRYGENEVTKSMRIIADHIRAATFIMADSATIQPSNVDQGYVVRKLIRRAIRHGRMIGIQDNFVDKVASVVIDMMCDIYTKLKENKMFVINNFIAEEYKFTKTLAQGLNQFEKIINRDGKINGVEAFNLFQTYGFPLELTRELASEKGLEIDDESFNDKFKAHQELSRTASAGKFKGGLGDHSEMAIKYHTATHLLQAALRKILGEKITQRGSNITDQRLRFDFSYDTKLTEEEKQKVENLVNEQIKQDLKVRCEELNVEEAKRQGALGVFEDKYGDKVKVYSIGQFSKEICGGPHVESTGALGKFKIMKESASSAGVRRIKANLS